MGEKKSLELRSYSVPGVGQKHPLLPLFTDLQENPGGASKLLIRNEELALVQATIHHHTVLVGSTKVTDDALEGSEINEQGSNNLLLLVSKSKGLSFVYVLILQGGEGNSIRCRGCTTLALHF